MTTTTKIPRFRALADRTPEFIDRASGCTCFMNGTNGDAPMSPAVFKRCRTPARFVGETSRGRVLHCESCRVHWLDAGPSANGTRWTALEVQPRPEVVAAKPTRHIRTAANRLARLFGFTLKARGRRWGIRWPRAERERSVAFGLEGEKGYGSDRPRAISEVLGWMIWHAHHHVGLSYREVAQLTGLEATERDLLRLREAGRWWELEIVRTITA